ncbi:hypothetical protein GDO81_025154, partial [Engystomops pustulosus]
MPPSVWCDRARSSLIDIGGCNSRVWGIETSDGGVQGTAMGSTHSPVLFIHRKHNTTSPSPQKTTNTHKSKVLQEPLNTQVQVLRRPQTTNTTSPSPAETTNTTSPTSPAETTNTTSPSPAETTNTTSPSPAETTNTTSPSPAETTNTTSSSPAETTNTTSPTNPTESTPTTQNTIPNVTSTSVGEPNTTGPTTASTVPTNIYIQIRITNYPYTDDLANPTSQYFKSLENNIIKMFNEVYNCSGCPTRKTYNRVIVLSFSAGSVIANTLVTFTEPLTPTQAKTILDDTLSKNGNQINDLTISDTKASDSLISSSSAATVPGWGIALLVLVSIILLAAIIFLIVMTIMLCRRRNSGYMDVFSSRGSYHSMNDYTSYQTHGRYVAPNKLE